MMMMWGLMSSDDILGTRCNKLLKLTISEGEARSGGGGMGALFHLVILRLFLPFLIITATIIFFLVCYHQYFLNLYFLHTIIIITCLIIFITIIIIIIIKIYKIISKADQSARRSLRILT